MKLQVAPQSFSWIKNKENWDQSNQASQISQMTKFLGKESKLLVCMAQKSK